MMSYGSHDPQTSQLAPSQKILKFIGFHNFYYCEIRMKQIKMNEKNEMKSGGFKIEMDEIWEMCQE